jgi:hypothetical protein
MFSDLVTSLTTRCPQYVRRMGYLSQMLALRGRHRRRRAGWQPHLYNTKKFILAAAGTCRKQDTVVVLGSGLLLDVPIEALADMFHEVVLVDVVHLPEVRKRIRRHKNVRTIRRDITSVAERLYWNVQQGQNELPASEPGIPGADTDIGLVISLNVLSQLTIQLQDYVRKKLPEHAEETITDWCDQIYESHYQALRALPIDVCLIADHEYVYRNREGNVIERGSTVGKVTLPEPDASWWWEIAPLGSASRYASKTLHVGAWHFRRQ